jgi:hypothetical protein
MRPEGLYESAHGKGKDRRRCGCTLAKTPSGAVRAYAEHFLKDLVAW